MTDAANKKVTINGTEYTYAAAVAKDTTAHTGAIAAGWYAKTPTAPNDENATTTPDFANVAAIKTAVKAGATVKMEQRASQE